MQKIMLLSGLIFVSTFFTCSAMEWIKLTSEEAEAVTINIEEDYRPFVKALKNGNEATLKKIVERKPFICFGVYCDENKNWALHVVLYKKNPNKEIVEILLPHTNFEHENKDREKPVQTARQMDKKNKDIGLRVYLYGLRGMAKTLHQTTGCDQETAFKHMLRTLAIVEMYSTDENGISIDELKKKAKDPKLQKNIDAAIQNVLDREKLYLEDLTKSNWCLLF